MIGNYSESLKHSFRAKEYASLPSHQIEIWFLIVSASMEAKDFKHIVSYIDKVQGIISHMSNSSSSHKSTNQQQSLSSTSTSTSTSEIVLTKAKCQIILGLSHLTERHYRQAAESFLHIIIPARSEQLISHLTVYEDIAVYTILCSVATFSRKEIKTKILENLNFKIFLEYTLHMKKFLTDFMDGSYAACYEFLSANKSKFQMDYYLCSQLNAIYEMIYEKILLQYLVPYKTVDLTKMSQVLGMTLDELEDRLVKQILNGHVQGRINCLTKTLHCYGPTSTNTTSRNDTNTSSSSSLSQIPEETTSTSTTSRIKQQSSFTTAAAASMNSNANDDFCYVDLLDTSEANVKYSQSVMLSRIHNNITYNQLLLQHILLKLDMQRFKMMVTVESDDATGRSSRRYPTVSAKQMSYTTSLQQSMLLSQNDLELESEGTADTAADPTTVTTTAAVKEGKVKGKNRDKTTTTSTSSSSNNINAGDSNKHMETDTSSSVNNNMDIDGGSSAAGGGGGGGGTISVASSDDDTGTEGGDDEDDDEGGMHQIEDDDNINVLTATHHQPAITATSQGEQVQGQDNRNDINIDYDDINITIVPT